jgi:hypothetical protein
LGSLAWLTSSGTSHTDHPTKKAKKEAPATKQSVRERSEMKGGSLKRRRQPSVAANTLRITPGREKKESTMK